MPEPKSPLARIKSRKRASASSEKRTRPPTKAIALWIATVACLATVATVVVMMFQFSVEKKQLLLAQTQPLTHITTHLTHEYLPYIPPPGRERSSVTTAILFEPANSSQKVIFADIRIETLIFASDGKICDIWLSNFFDSNADNMYSSSHFVKLKAFVSSGSKSKIADRIIFGFSNQLAGVVRVIGTSEISTIYFSEQGFEKIVPLSENDWNRNWGSAVQGTIVADSGPRGFHIVLDPYNSPKYCMEMNSLLVDE
jgi:hypothetical protein